MKLLLYSLVVLGPVCTNAAKLVQLQIVTRNGHDTEEDTLSPFGSWQMQQLGDTLKEKYSNFFIDAPLPEATFDSAGDALALASAQSLQVGLFPERAVPDAVYSTDPTEDRLLLAYDKCPSIQTSFQFEFRSGIWREEVQANLEGLNEFVTALLSHEELLKHDPETLLSSLEDTATIYHDIMRVCPNATTDPTCFEEKLGVSPEQVNGLHGWARAIEVTKYSLTPHLLGGSLLMKVFDRANASRQQPEQDHHPKQVYVYSAHYETIMSVWAALGQTPETLPRYASAFIFELYYHDTKDQEGGENERLYYFRIASLDDYNSTASQYLKYPLGCLNPNCPPNEDEDIILTKNFHPYVQFAPSTERWCKACQNNSTQECQIQNLQAELTAERAAARTAASHCTSRAYEGFHTLFVIVGSLIAGLAIGFCITWGIAHCDTKGRFINLNQTTNAERSKKKKNRTVNNRVIAEFEETMNSNIQGDRNKNNNSTATFGGESNSRLSGLRLPTFV